MPYIFAPTCFPYVLPFSLHLLLLPLLLPVGSSSYGLCVRPCSSRSSSTSLLVGVAHSWPMSCMCHVTMVACVTRHGWFDLAEPPVATADRTLKLVTKVVQNVANLVEFRAKEPYMIDLNPFIVKNIPYMRQFVDELAVRHYA